MKKVYLVANAHLDPVWLWRWQEGCSEASFPEVVYDRGSGNEYSCCGD